MGNWLSEVFFVLFGPFVNGWPVLTTVSIMSKFGDLHMALIFTKLNWDIINNQFIVDMHHYGSGNIIQKELFFIYVNKLLVNSSVGVVFFLAILSR